MPPEIELGNAVDRYGGMTVYGRAIGAFEMRRISMSENIVALYNAREGNDWVEWGNENEASANLLGLALRAALDMGLMNAE